MKKVLFVCLFVFGLCSSAGATPRYEADVSVDVTAKTVAEAKKQAMSKALRDGLNEIILGISTDEAVKNINELNDNQLEHFITGIMVLMEKTSDVRYIADLRIKADGELLKSYIAENNLPLIISEEKDIVLIPIFEDKDGVIDIWGDDNIWRQAFLDRPRFHKNNISFRIIDKNLGNIAMIKENRGIDIPTSVYHELADFNHADGLYFLKYSLKEGKILLKKYPEENTQEVLIAEDSPTKMIDKVIPLLKENKENISSDDKTIAIPIRVEIVYNYSKLAQWASLRTFLNSNPQVQDIKIVSMANGKVHFNFLYSGAVEKLQGSLRAEGYNIRNEGEYYVIY